MAIPDTPVFTAAQTGTAEFCQQPADCMIDCHDCGCDYPDGPFFCPSDHPGKCSA